MPPSCGIDEQTTRLASLLIYCTGIACEQVALLHGCPLLALNGLLVRGDNLAVHARGLPTVTKAVLAVIQDPIGPPVTEPEPGGTARLGVQRPEDMNEKACRNPAGASESHELVGGERSLAGGQESFWQLAVHRGGA